MANMDGSNRTLLFSGQKGPVGASLPCLPRSPSLIPQPGHAFRVPQLTHCFPNSQL